MNSEEHGGQHQAQPVRCFPESRLTESQLVEAAEELGVAMDIVDAVRERRAARTRIRNIDHARAAAFTDEADEAGVGAMTGPPAGATPGEYSRHKQRWNEDIARGNAARQARLEQLCADHGLTVVEHDVDQQAWFQAELARIGQRATAAYQEGVS